MAEQLALATLVAGGAAPSEEAILHALPPPSFLDDAHSDGWCRHQHAAGAVMVREVNADRVLVVPYVMPGSRRRIALRDAGRRSRCGTTSVSGEPPPSVSRRAVHLRRSGRL